MNDATLAQLFAGTWLLFAVAGLITALFGLREAAANLDAAVLRRIDDARLLFAKTTVRRQAIYSGSLVANVLIAGWVLTPWYPSPTFTIVARLVLTGVVIGTTFNAALDFRNLRRVLAGFRETEWPPST
jgi:hypothetical protein